MLALPTVQAAGTPAITVHLFDLAGVPDAVLAPSIEIATRLYADAGVPLRWVRQAPPVAKPGQGTSFRAAVTPTAVSLRLLPKHVSDRLIRPGSTKLGIAYPAVENDYRYLASVFYDRVELAAAALDDVSLPVLLGHIMAHELGHLLLGPGAHARETIMACPWDTNEFRFVKRGRLGFDKRQRALLRSQVAARDKAAESVAGTRQQAAVHGGA